MTDKTMMVDVALVGGGVMSATLGVLLKHVRPDWSIRAFERLDDVALESSGTWNNAGTGHASLCELNYTPQRPDGSIDVTKALLVNQQFHESRQLWSSLVDRGIISSARSFISPVPHMSFVRGKEDVEFLKKRYETLVREPLFQELRISTNMQEISDWLPLMMRGRSPTNPIAVSRSNEGADVDFGSLVALLFEHLRSSEVDVQTGHEVRSVKRGSGARWHLDVRSRKSGEMATTSARFVFVGAGGGALNLLQTSGIAEIRGYGGFPVSGHFLHCSTPSIVAGHQAKVYGKPTLTAPPMAMPHLDKRVIRGKPSLLFGPYAGFSPKFLKYGSYFDLTRSVSRDNLLTMLTVARNEFPLTRYLVRQVIQSSGARIDVLRDFVPSASGSDWTLNTAGQRVQTMKRGVEKRGVLEFGTEMVAAGDGSIAGVLGASPGASTAVSIMLDVMRTCFPDEYPAWLPRLRELIPSAGISLSQDATLLADVRAFTDKTLGLGGSS